MLIHKRRVWDDLLRMIVDCARGLRSGERSSQTQVGSNYFYDFQKLVANLSSDGWIFQNIALTEQDLREASFVCIKDKVLLHTDLSRRTVCNCHAGDFHAGKIDVAIEVPNGSANDIRRQRLNTRVIRPAVPTVFLYFGE